MDRSLLHRWFVQYNPIYLLSATLVLGGMFATSRGLAHEGSLHGPLGVALIAEIYACALIFGAALLTRIGQPRPAVMLALITVLYQGDLTLHTETCAYLGGVGVVAALAWLALFVGKLYALAWALRVRLAPRAIAAAVVGAAGLTLGPHVLDAMDARMAGGAIALFVFALGSVCPRSPEASLSAVGALDDSGHLVLRRTVRATWIVWCVVLALHLLFWSTQHHIQLGAVVPALALVSLPRISSERRVWLGVVTTMVVVFVVAPGTFATSALLVAITLALRAYSCLAGAASPSREPAPIASQDRSPYRMKDPPERAAASHVAPASFVFVGPDAAARGRLLAGSLFGVYLFVWTLGWTGGSLPAHVLSLDISLAAGLALVVWRTRARVALAPLSWIVAHGVDAFGLVPQPRSLVEWGGAAVALGFVLLVGSLATSYRLRHVTAPPGRHET